MTFCLHQLCQLLNVQGVFSSIPRLGPFFQYTLWESSEQTKTSKLHKLKKILELSSTLKGFHTLHMNFTQFDLYALMQNKTKQ